MKAGIGRGQLAGDCYYNVGILSAMQGDRCRALEMFELSKPLRLGQHGEGKDPIAEVLENQGMTYAERNDYFTAYESFDQALKIRLNNHETSAKQCLDVVRLISDLYDKICLELTEQEEGRKQYTLQSLKSRIESSQLYMRLLKLSKEVKKEDEKQVEGKKNLKKKLTKEEEIKTEEVSQE